MFPDISCAAIGAVDGKNTLGAGTAHQTLKTKPKQSSYRLGKREWEGMLTLTKVRKQGGR